MYHRSNRGLLPPADPSSESQRRIFPTIFRNSGLSAAAQSTDRRGRQGRFGNYLRTIRCGGRDFYVEAPLVHGTSGGGEPGPIRHPLHGAQSEGLHSAISPTAAQGWAKASLPMRVWPCVLSDERKQWWRQELRGKRIVAPRSQKRCKPMATVITAGWLRGPELEQALRRRQEHSQRCRALPPLEPGEADRLVSEFAAKRSGLTKCPTAYLVPLQQ